jgi:predicted esterase
VFLRFAQHNDIYSSLQLYEDLESFSSSEGPFDGIIGFSEGAGVAASILAYHERLCTAKLRSPFSLKCGIFFSAGPPLDIDALQQGKLQQLNVANDKHVINFPTAHIWAAMDDVHPGFGPAARSLCADDSVEVFVHDLGHNIPGTRSEEGVAESVKAIRRTIERARDH